MTFQGDDMPFFKFVNEKLLNDNNINNLSKFAKTVEDLLKTDIDNKSHIAVPADIIEYDNLYCIYIDVPGLSKDNIDLNLDHEEHIINIKFKRTNIYEGLKKEALIKVERIFGDFEKSLVVPNNSDLNNIKAHINNGILVINIPKYTVKKVYEKIFIS